MAAGLPSLLPHYLEDSGRVGFVPMRKGFRSMRTRYTTNKTLWIVAAGLGMTVFLSWIRLGRSEVSTMSNPAANIFQGEGGSLELLPLEGLFKLAVAALLGIVVTAVHRHFDHGRRLHQSIEQAQILLCVAGALMMIIIGNSVARAFGVVGAASLVRFRTLVQDPRDTTVIFLLLGIGMASGLAAFEVAALAALFLCFLLMILDHLSEPKPREILLEIAGADGGTLPTAHIQNVLSSSGVVFEPRGFSQDKNSSAKYYVLLSPKTSLDFLSKQLMGDGSTGIQAVKWHPPKKKQAEELEELLDSTDD